MSTCSGKNCQIHFSVPVYREDEFLRVFLSLLVLRVVCGVGFKCFSSFSLSFVLLYHVAVQTLRISVCLYTVDIPF